jgi:hypothetical protein
MNRFEILKAIPAKTSIIPDYYFGIDVGYSQSTVIAVCFRNNRGVVTFPHIESRTCGNFQSVFDWYVKLAGKYPIISGCLEGAKDISQLRGLIQKLDPNNIGHLKINQVPHDQLKSGYAIACENNLVVLPEFILSEPAIANWGLFRMNPASLPANVARAVYLAYNIAEKKD